MVLLRAVVRLNGNFVLSSLKGRGSSIVLSVLCFAPDMTIWRNDFSSWLDLGQLRARRTVARKPWSVVKWDAYSQ